jgi:hypothetical protein
VINPGSAPAEGASEAAAAANLEALMAAVVERGGRLAGEPVRVPETDEDGRFAWRLPAGEHGGGVLVLMPGVELAKMRDDMSASAPRIIIGGNPWWWPSAVGQVAAAATAVRSLSE